MKLAKFTSILGFLLVIASYISLGFPVEKKEPGFAIYYTETPYTTPLAIAGFSTIGIGFLIAACIRWRSDGTARDKSLSLASCYLLFNIPFSLFVGMALWFENPELFAAVWPVLQVWFLVGCIGVHTLWFPKKEPEPDTLNEPSPWTISL